MEDPNEEVTSVREGDLLAGKYRVEKVLGVGGMGVVVAAHHIGLDNKVAIKFLLPGMLGNREAVERFEREGRAAVRITSEHVARVFDVGTLDTGAPYIVMEFLDGADLASWLRQRGPLPIEQAVDFVLQVCVAVADAHGLGIVHRDLKPANFFCIRRSDGQLFIKVLDFGISKVRYSDSSPQPLSVTRTNAIMGSPLYMSPEQLRSPKEVDAQTDIWALGASLYELVAGKVPFEGSSIAELAIKLATQVPPPLRGLRAEVPAGLEAVVLKCLERERSRRYKNVAELAVALLEFAPKRAKVYVERISAIILTTGLSATATQLPPSHDFPFSPAGPSTIPPVGRTSAGLKRRRTGITGFLAIAGLALVAGALGLRGKFEGKPTTMPSPAAPPPAVVQAALGHTAEASSSPVPVVPEPAALRDASAETPPRHAVSRPAPHSDSKPHASAAASSAPSSAASVPAPPAVNCDPPFYFDDHRARVFKKECVR